ncbi:15992_t:CDS:2 [Dentiscutata erythropus]|uniref:15992_t:CDS:1 n=1 Tax=Dentiscutata erythropus TaxID=1348616 RepID=A0A9N8ZIR6_9GLOM|nr:15992_t:CDS:2 [Dentiscutata erythropus]
MEILRNSELGLSDFFELSFGLGPIEFDPTSFVTEELTIDLFTSLIKPSLCESNPRGIFRNLFPYLVDYINRTIPLTRFVNHVNYFIDENDKLNDPQGILQRFRKCTGRDFFIAFLDKISINSLPKLLNAVIYANIPIPIFLPNDMVNFEKGLRVLDAMHNIIDIGKYHLFVSVNQANTKMKSPFTKQIYKCYSNNREDRLGLCHPGSLDISFHAASENNDRHPLAISEIYYDETNSQIFQNVVNELSKAAYYIVIHAFDSNFNIIEPNDEFKAIINNISIERHGTNSRTISVLFWGVNKEDNIIKKRKQRVLDILIKQLFHDQIRVEIITEEKESFFFEEFKEYSFQKLLNTPNLYLSATAFRNLFNKNYDSEVSFSTLMEATTFKSRADIFTASYFSNEIDALNDKIQSKNSEDSATYMTEDEINDEIKKLQELQKNLCGSDPIPVLKNFAQVIKKNNITYMREFARQIDSFVKTNLNELALKYSELNQTDQDNDQKSEIKQQIEDRNITIHDFWKEFIVLSQIKKRYSTALKSLYNIDNTQLETAYKSWICEGEAIQILESDSFRALNSEFLLDIFNQITFNNKRPLIVLSIIGPENSGVYMSYRHTIHNGKETDFLILDFEGIDSITERLISQRNDFDKKITLLATLCSQILILNVKELTQDISDILEVSSYHLDTLIKRNFKPRINFVLRDMMEVDTRNSQQYAFNNIREGLKRMFNEIPGCAYNMESLMMLEEENIHLLENAFSCTFDEFYPNTKQIDQSDHENFYYPTETFPSEVSKLREELLAFSSNEHEYKSIDEFISYIQTIWKEIDARGKFLHYKNFEMIHQWNSIRKLVSVKDESFIKIYKEEISDLIDEIESDQWSKEQDIKFEAALTKVTNTICQQTISDFLENASDEFDPTLIEKGMTYINSAFTSEKRKLQAAYTIKRRKFKDSWLIESAKAKISENIKQVLKEKTPGKVKKNLLECDHYFNTEWEYIEADKKNFINSMSLETKALEEQVVTCFNKAITDGISLIGSDDETKDQFDRNFWSKLEKPATLVQSKFLKNTEFLKSFDFKFVVEPNSSGIAGYINNAKKGISKQSAIRTIKTSIKKTCKQIVNEIQNENTLTIEFDQALEWIQRLCDNIFVTLHNELNSSQNNLQYLRLKVFKRLDANTKKWKDIQQKELDEYRKNLWKFFVELKSDTYYEYLSTNFFELIFQSFEKQLNNPYNFVSELMDKYFNCDDYNITRIAHERSFGSLNVENCCNYIENPIKFMKKLFEEEIRIIKDIKIGEKLEEIEENIINTIPNELKEIISKSKQYYSSRPIHESSYICPNIEQILRSSKGTLLEILMKDKSQGTDTILKCVVKYPSRFLACLEENIDKVFSEFENRWKNKLKNHCKTSMIIKVENYRSLYCNKVIGCQERCPLCGSKCELADHNSDIPHKTSIHLMVSFNGVKNKSNEASLNICTDSVYQSDTCDEFHGHSFGNYIQTCYPKWYPIDPMDTNEDQLKQLRTMWILLKSEICNKHASKQM